MLWNKNFTLLALSNFLLHLAVYMLFPLFYFWLKQQWGCTPLQAAGIAVLPGFSMFLPGAFNNYLTDTFCRKQVCMRSIFLLGILALLYPYITQLWMVTAVRILQGVLWGIALMATGSTLAIDVTPRNRRDAANRVFTWSGILGLLAGSVVGLQGYAYFPLEYLLYFSAGGCVTAGLLISFVEVCFRAPLNVPLLSFDRFILFRTLLPGINMLCVPFVLGMLFVENPNIFFYLCIMGGFIGYLFIRELFTAPMNGRMQILLGQLLTVAGVLVLMNVPDSMGECGSGILLGLGMGFSLGQFLRMMILLPLHCERGTGYHTYQLLWQVGMMCGILASVYFRQVHGISSCMPALAVCILGFLFYQVYIHGYFSRNLPA